MPQIVQSMASIDPTWYGIILAAILCILQLIYQSGSGDDGLKVESHFLFLKTISLYASMSLITLTSCKPLPSCKGFKISIFFVILACTSLLSAAVPNKLWWVPHLSCIRPFFELLRDLYLFSTNTLLNHFWEFCVRIGNAAVECKRRAQEIIQCFVPVNVGPSSSTPANLNPEGVMQNIDI